MRFLAVAAVLLAACSGGRGTGTNEAGYNELPKGEVHAAMWQISQSLDSLDGLMRAPTEPLQKRAEAVKLLQRIEAHARKLTDASYRHPMLERNLVFFVDAVVQARAAAEADPPNFYLAGTVSGSCVYCHDPKGGIRH